MKDVTKSIKIAVFLCVAIVFTVTGCKEEHTGDTTTDTPPYVNGGEEPQPFPDDIPEMSSKLVRALEKSGVDTPVFNLTFSKNGDITLMVSADSDDRGTPSLMEAAREINRVTTISIVDFKNNPGCVWINIGGRERILCEKIN